MRDFPVTTVHACVCREGEQAGYITTPPIDSTNYLLPVDLLKPVFNALQAGTEGLNVIERGVSGQELKDDTKGASVT